MLKSGSNQIVPRLKVGVFQHLGGRVSEITRRSRNCCRVTSPVPTGWNRSRGQTEIRITPPTHSPVRAGWFLRILCLLATIAAAALSTEVSSFIPGETLLLRGRRPSSCIRYLRNTIRGRAKSYRIMSYIFCKKKQPMPTPIGRELEKFDAHRRALGLSNSLRDHNEEGEATMSV